MTDTPAPPGPPRLASLDTEQQARRRHPTRGGPRPATAITPPPGLRGSPVAWSIVIGVAAASAVLWVMVVAAVFGLFAELLTAQADMAVMLAEVTAPDCDTYGYGHLPEDPAAGHGAAAGG